MGGRGAIHNINVVALQADSRFLPAVGMTLISGMTLDKKSE
jgi:hypothetical protein